MEICQRQTISGKINLNIYIKLTKVKVAYLNTFVREAELDQDSADAVLKLLENHNLIRCSFIKIAGR
jgi:hypothetical protein